MRKITIRMSVVLSLALILQLWAPALQGQGAGGGRVAAAGEAEEEWTVTERIDLSTAGEKVYPSATTPDITPDGRYIVFESSSTSMDPRLGSGTNYTWHIYWHDRLTGKTELIDARGSDAAGIANASSERPRISDDGQRIVFYSLATNLTDNESISALDPDSPDNYRRVYLHDRTTGTMSLISVNSAGDPADYFSQNAAISGDGGTVVFESEAGNLAGAQGDYLYRWQIYAHDLDTGTTVLVSDPETGMAYRPDISADGSYVSYVVNQYDQEYGKFASDVYRADIVEGEKVKVTAVTGYSEFGDGAYRNPAISGDGQRIVFESSTDDPTPGDTSGFQDIWLYDSQEGSGSLLRVSAGEDGTPGNGDSSSPSISPDGRYVGFVSAATNLRDGIQIEAQFNKKVAYMFDSLTGALTNLGGLQHAKNGWSPALSNHGFAYDDTLYVYAAIRDANELPSWPSGKGLSVARQSDGSVQLSWTVNPAEELLGYKVFEKRPHPTLGSYYSVEKLLGYTTGSSFNAGQPPADPTGVSYRVEAVNGLYHTSQDGPVAPLEPEEDTAPPYWESSAAPEKRQVAASSIALAWPAARDNIAVAGYKVYRSLSQAAGYAPAGETLAPEFRDEGLQPDTEYFYRITALDASGNESAPLSITVRTLTEADPEGGQLTAQALANGDVRLYWSAGAAAVRYELWDARPDRTPAEIGDFTSGQTEYVISELEPGTVYVYKVYGYGANDELVYETLPASVETARLAAASVDVSRTSLQGGVVPIGSSETVTVKGQPGRTALATAVYTTWYDIDGATLLASPRETSVELPMTESASQPGLYTGTFAFEEGIEKLLRLDAKLDDGAGRQSPVVSAPGLPLTVAAALSLRLDSEASLHRYKVNVYNPSTQAAQSKTVEEEGASATLLFDRLKAGSGAQIRVFDPSGKLLWQMAGAELKSGLSAEQAAEIVPYKKLTARLMNGQEPIAGLAVTIKDEQGNYTTLTTAADGRLPATEWSADNSYVTLSVQNLPIQFARHDAVRIDLVQLHTEREIVMALRPVGVITGKVTVQGGGAIQGAAVQIRQTLDGRDYTRNVTTDAQGHYELQGYAGTAELIFSDRNRDEELKQIAVSTTSANVVNHEFVLPVRQTLKIKLYTKYKDGEWQGPLPIDWTTGIHMGVKVDGATVQSDTVDLMKPQGASVTVEADGAEGGLGRASQTVVLDGYTEVELRLQQEAFQVFGSLQWPEQWAGYPGVYWSGQLLKRNETGDWDTINYVGGMENNVSLYGQGAGTFKLALASNAGRAERIFQSDGSSAVDLGELQLREEPTVFENRDDSSLTAYPLVLVAGQTTKVRMAYDASEASENVQFVLNLPYGTELLANSVVLNGAPVAYTTEGNRVVVHAGDLSANSRGTIIYALKVLDAAAERLPLSGQVRFVQEGTEKQETIGAVTLTQQMLTLQAPQFAESLAWSLGGQAPAGAVVSVYASGTMLGQTTAGPGGYWKLDVSAPDPQGAEVFLVHAESEWNGAKRRSESSRVHYDPERPSIKGLTIEQTDGRRVTIDVSRGPVRFPYVVIPHYAFKFEVLFNRPDKVKNVKVHIRDGESTTTAGAEYRDGVFYAELGAGWKMTEAVYVTFDRVEDGPMSIESMDELKAELPPAMRDYKVKEQQDFVATSAGTMEGSVDISLPQANDLDIRVDLKLQRDSGYTPTAEDIRQAEALGVEVYGTTYELVQDDGEMRLMVTAYVPEDAVGNTASLLSALTAAPVARPKGTVRIANNAGSSLLKVTVDVLWNEKNVVGQAGKGIGQIYDTQNAVGGRDQVAGTMDELGGLADQIGKCNPAMAGYFGQQIEQTATHALAVEVAKWGLMIAGAALAPATLGLSVGLMAASTAIGMAMDATVNHQMDRLKERINRSASGKCDPDDNGGGVTEINLGNPVAAPVWIYDPSGYVYETFPDNRIADVKATIYYSDEAAGGFAPWDAEWYGQSNPQMTDAMGKYGWDVPPGLWQVVYEKDGYETARSAELRVLPPHFDVNIPMISYASPEVGLLEAESDGDGTVVTIVFDKYMAVNGLAADAVAVSLNGTKLAGEVEAVEPRAGENGVMLSRTFRFVSDTVVSPGDEVLAAVKASYAVSYAGIAMETDYAAEAVVLAKDTAAPALLSAAAETLGSRIELRFSEALDLGRPLAAADFTLTGTPLSVASAQYGADGRTIRLALNGKLPSGGVSGLQAQVAANKMYDSAGNAYAGGQLAVDVSHGPSDAYLSALQVEGYSLTPSFQPERRDYQVTVPQGVTALQVKASGRDAGTTLRIGGIAATAGAAVAAPIEEEAVIVAATARDGVTKRYYEIKVVRGTVGSPGSGLSGPSQPGAGAVKTSSDGKLDLGPGEAGIVSLGDEASVSVPKDAMSKAVRITIGKAERYSMPERKEGLALASGVYEFGKNAEDNFAEPVTITLRLNQRPARGQQAAIYYYDETARRWVSIGGTTDGDTISATVDHFTQFAAFLTASLPQLSDTDGHWGADYIRQALRLGFVTGYPDSTFRPDVKVTRAEFAKMLSQALQLEGGTGDVSFSDASAIPDWAQAHVAAAAKAGIIGGYENGEFRPNRSITRSEIVVMLARALELPSGGEAATSFADDADIPAWAKQAVASAASEGFVQGRAGNRFAPSGETTRAEAVKLLVLMLDWLEQKEQEQEQEQAEQTQTE